MAERSLIQYQPITGPVWTEPVASRLAWIPKGNSQPARKLAPNRLGDFQQPPFEALYKAQGLQWTPEDSYKGRPLPYALTRRWVIDPIPPVNPAHLSWEPSDGYRGRALPKPARDWSVYPLQVIVAAYDPQTMEWTLQGRQPQRQLEPRRLGDYQRPIFEALYRPDGLQWMLQGRQSPVPVERRRLGDYQRPLFEALFRPDSLTWQPSDRYAGKALPYTLTRYAVIDPIPPVNPAHLSWQSEDSYRGREPKRSRYDSSVYPLQPVAAVYDASAMEWVLQGRAPQRLPERRRTEFQQPAHEAIRTAFSLQWQSSDRYAGRPKPYAYQARFVVDPLSLFYNPVGMQWALPGARPQRGVPFARQGFHVIDPTSWVVVVASVSGPADRSVHCRFEARLILADAPGFGVTVDAFGRTVAVDENGQLVVVKVNGRTIN